MKNESCFDEWSDGVIDGWYDVGCWVHRIFSIHFIQLPITEGNEWNRLIWLVFMVIWEEESLHFYFVSSFHDVIKMFIFGLEIQFGLLHEQI